MALVLIPSPFSLSLSLTNYETVTANGSKNLHDPYLDVFSFSSTVDGVSIVKRQASEDNDAELCKGRPPSEYFRLTADEDCRDVVRCSVQGLLALRCPSGLAFDIDKQTCDWKSNVKNCQQLESKSPPNRFSGPNLIPNYRASTGSPAVGHRRANL